MTEKRFEYVYLDELGVNAIQDNVTGKHTPLSDKIADKLNELNDENEQLKKDCSILVQSNQEYRKENEELKQTLRIYRKVANCRNCDYHDYDCREDGDDFEICTKGKDMEDGICEDWREL